MNLNLAVTFLCRKDPSSVLAFKELKHDYFLQLSPRINF